MNNYIIELWAGVYYADIEGDPGRTIVKENAEQFNQYEKAELKLTKLRRDNPHRNFDDAKILIGQFDAQVSGIDRENSRDKVTGYLSLSKDLTNDTIEENVSFKEGKQRAEGA